MDGGHSQSRVLKGARFNESIALGAWGTEFHIAETMDSVFKLPGGNGVYEIPLGAVTSVDTANLFAAGRTADGDQMAGASLRVMGTAFATGQACGVATALPLQQQPARRRHEISMEPKFLQQTECDEESGRN